MISHCAEFAVFKFALVESEIDKSWISYNEFALSPSINLRQEIVLHYSPQTAQNYFSPIPFPLIK